MLQSYVRTFKLYDVDTVYNAALAAAKSLGHSVESTEGAGDTGLRPASADNRRIVLKTAKSPAIKAGKKMVFTVSKHPQGHTWAEVHGPIFFAQKRPLRFGEELFTAMDVILAS